MKKILVVGSINIDLFIKTKKIPIVGETLFGDTFEIFCGGKGANQAVAASRLGANVSFIGAVGDDINGEIALENLKKENINIEAVKVVKGVPTGIANIISSNGDNSIIVVKGANEKVDEQYIDEVKDMIINSDIVLIQNEIPFSGVKKAMQIAKEYDKSIIYNPAPLIDNIDNLCKLATYCTPNEIEAQGIKNMENLIITLGDQGVKYKEVIYPANKVKVIDTTGAGDTFNGALCAALAKDFPINDAIKYGIKASGISIKSTGAQSGMPYEKEMK